MNNKVVIGEPWILEYAKPPSSRALEYAKPPSSRARVPLDRGNKKEFSPLSRGGARRAEGFLALMVHRLHKVVACTLATDRSVEKILTGIKGEIEDASGTLNAEIVGQKICEFIGNRFLKDEADWKLAQAQIQKYLSGLNFFKHLKSLLESEALETLFDKGKGGFFRVPIFCSSTIGSYKGAPFRLILFFVVAINGKQVQCRFHVHLVGCKSFTVLEPKCGTGKLMEETAIPVDPILRKAYLKSQPEFVARLTSKKAVEVTIAGAKELCQNACVGQLGAGNIHRLVLRPVSAKYVPIGLTLHMYFLEECDDVNSAVKFYEQGNKAQKEGVAEALSCNTSDLGCQSISAHSRLRRRVNHSFKSFKRRHTKFNSWFKPSIWSTIQSRAIPSRRFGVSATLARRAWTGFRPALRARRSFFLNPTMRFGQKSWGFTGMRFAPVSLFSRNSGLWSRQVWGMRGSRMSGRVALGMGILGVILVLSANQQQKTR